MKNLHRLPAQLLMLGCLITLFTALFQPTSASAAPIKESRPISDAGTSPDCLVLPDKTKDCSNIFIEVGEEPANAASLMPGCSGYSCDGQDPYAMGCNVSYGVVDVTYLGNFGYVQLWWSNTCQTNWARVVRTTSGTHWNLHAAVMREKVLGDWPSCYNVPQGPGPRMCAWQLVGSSVYTDMLYAPTAQAAAYGGIFYGTSGNWGWTNWW